LGCWELSLLMGLFGIGFRFGFGNGDGIREDIELQWLSLRGIDILGVLLELVERESADFVVSDRTSVSLSVFILAFLFLIDIVVELVKVKSTSGFAQIDLRFSVVVNVLFVLLEKVEGKVTDFLIGNWDLILFIGYFISIVKCIEVESTGTVNVSVCGVGDGAQDSKAESKQKDRFGDGHFWDFGCV
jgi:hypothetical protein